MATHSSTLDWKIPWMEEPGGYSPQGHKESDNAVYFTFTFKTLHEPTGRTDSRLLFKLTHSNILSDISRHIQEGFYFRQQRTVKTSMESRFQNYVFPYLNSKVICKIAVFSWLCCKWLCTYTYIYTYIQGWCSQCLTTYIYRTLQKIEFPQAAMQG